MTDSAPDQPARRPRYPGRNPRQFHQKYKELQPEKYADDVARIAASGRTPAGTHRPIMVAEIMKVLAPQSGEIAVDCTLGFGGHARELLAAVQPSGRLIAVDADPLELPKTESRLRALGFPDESLIVRRMNFAGLSSVVLTEFPDGADVILADLGLSSMQIDNPDRGFTFKSVGPLDMRLNPQHGQPASRLLSRIGETKLAEILTQNADEPNAKELARVILASHSQAALETTSDLARVVMQFSQKCGGSVDAAKETVRRVFQAIRIEVNDEFGALEALLRQLPACLKPKGRVAILSFHSGEDRRVKRAFKEGLRNGAYSAIAEDMIRPSIGEQKSNPRSTSAKLRFAVRAEIVS